ncbi:MAG TPA: hypothetical protein VMF11_07525 [Candidatus Baltobacteraceae bacterium]|nr:hypothetical protein [Candidatus Baltobacteraceae bacterium]
MNVAATVIFISQFDASSDVTISSIRYWLKRYERVVIVEAPLTGEGGLSFSDLLFAQRALYQKMRTVADSLRIPVVLLRLPYSPSEYLQADKIHPNALGQREIARQLQPYLGELGICRTSPDPRLSVAPAESKTTARGDLS